MYFTSILATACLTSLAVAAPPMPFTRRDNVLFNSGSGQVGTYYYENAHDGDACAADGSQGQGWSTNQIKGYPMCEYHVDGSQAKTLEGIDTNRIVAISRTRIMAGLNGQAVDLCGKQVNVYLNGQMVNFSEGPFFVYDGCERCDSTAGIDFSGQAYAELFGGCKSGLSTNTGVDLRFEVVDNTIMTQNTAGQWNGAGTTAHYH